MGLGHLRTCYTPESEDLWANAIRLVHTWLDYKTRLALQERGEEEEHEEVMAQLDNVLIEDPSLENASFDQLRSRFATWLATQDTDNPDGNRYLPLQRFKEFIVLDSSALQSTKDAPSPDDRQAGAHARLAPYVKVVAAQHSDGARLAPTRTARSGQNVDEDRLFPGFMRVSIIELRLFWEESFSYDLLELCPRRFTDEPDWKNRFDVF
ncbi:unnamed protein product [Aureobasidium mustum]|uniref:Uncharacterized protein n=1 Tax=Aureobasidium mustum TaxID=2773714 RepID=A0A9N8K2D4_9PEZI|nr:unnamed protein product [Aureobasidium mustum]